MICLIRQKMQHFISMIDQYVYSEIIDKCWILLQDKLSSATGYYQILDAHNEYLARIVEKCFLSKSGAKIHSQLVEMFKLIFSFQTAVTIFFGVRVAPFVKKKMVR